VRVWYEEADERGKHYGGMMCSAGTTRVKLTGAVAYTLALLSSLGIT
jgi:hypothetical protein